MAETRAGDLYLARLISKRPYRWTLYGVFFLTASASLYLRVGLGRSDQALPWYGVLLSAYGFGMTLASADARCRLAYACFGVLVAAAFTRAPLAAHARLVGAVEVICCLAILSALASLGRDEAFLKGAVLESGDPGKKPPQDPDATTPRP